MLHLWTRLLLTLGIEPRGFAALVRTFLLLDLRGQHFAQATATKPHYLLSPLFWVVSQCLTLSAGTSLVLCARVDVCFFAFVHLSLGMVVTPTTLLVEFHEVVLNPGDLQVLGHHPVDPTTYAAARCVNLLFNLGRIYLETVPIGGCGDDVAEIISIERGRGSSKMEYVALYEPDGTLNGYVTLQYAIDYCRTHPGWTLGYVEATSQ